MRLPQSGDNGVPTKSTSFQGFSICCLTLYTTHNKAGVIHNKEAISTLFGAIIVYAIPALSANNYRRLSSPSIDAHNVAGEKWMD